MLLGCGIATPIPYSAFVVLVGTQLTAGGALGCVSGALFGLAREAMPAVVVLWRWKNDQADPGGIMRLLPTLATTARRLNRAWVLVGGVALVLTTSVVQAQPPVTTHSNTWRLHRITAGGTSVQRPLQRPHVIARKNGPPPLGPAPTTCPTNAPPATINPNVGKSIGMSPAWADGDFASGLILHVGDPRRVRHGPHGWYHKIVWVVAPDYHQPITLRGGALVGGTALWFQIGDHTLSPAPTLHPAGGGWAYYGSYLLIPRAGCYFLQASWPGGMWRLAFAAGQ